MAAPGLLRVRVKVGVWDYTEDLESQTAIAQHNDVDALNRGLAESAGRYATWAMLEAEARSEVATAERDLRTFRAKQTEILLREKVSRSKRQSDVTALYTTAAITARILASQEYKRLTDRLLAAKLTLHRTTVGRKAIRQHKDALLAIGANLRGEMDNRLRTRGAESRAPLPPPPTRRG